MNLKNLQKFEYISGFLLKNEVSLNKAILVARTISEAYYYLNYAVWNHGKNFRFSRNQPEDTKDVGVVSLEGASKAIMVDLTITHPWSEQLRKHEKDPNDYGYADSYGALYLLSAEKGGETYTYGSRLREGVDQIDQAIKVLKQKPHSRQVSLTVSRPGDLSLPDPPCLRLVDFKIYEGSLTVTAFFRSWDIFGAANVNLIGLNDLQRYIANEVGVKQGVLQVHSPNAHIYPSAYKLVEEWVTGKGKETESFAEKLGYKEKHLISMKEA
ncbi:MAG: thymidylate synthase [Candidatus Hodarchaeota archaeon]